MAVSILALGLVGAMRVFPVGLRASHRSELSSRACFLAQRTLEELKLRAWDQLESAPGAADGPFEIDVAVDQPELEGVEDASRVKRVAVEVRWTDESRPRHLSLVTYLSQPSS